jgi:hypothetical protein
VWGERGEGRGQKKKSDSFFKIVRRKMKNYFACECEVVGEEEANANERETGRKLADERQSKGNQL